MKHKFAIIIKTALDREVVFRALKVAVIVGTLLNLINQGDKLFALDFGALNDTKLFLTFLAPYAVSSYTAISMKLTRSENADDASEDRTLICPKFQ